MIRLLLNDEMRLFVVLFDGQEGGGRGKFTLFTNCLL